MKLDPERRIDYALSAIWNVKRALSGAAYSVKKRNIPKIFEVCCNKALLQSIQRLPDRVSGFCYSYDNPEAQVLRRTPAKTAKMSEPCCRLMKPRRGTSRSKTATVNTARSGFSPGPIYIQANIELSGIAKECQADEIARKK